VEIIQFADGVLVSVETVEPERSYEMRRSAVQVMAKFGDIAADLRERMDQIGAELKTSVTAPEEIVVEFGVEIEGEAGLPVIAKGRANCHIVVTATWRRPASD
jgi:hypothetical protein